MTPVTRTEHYEAELIGMLQLSDGWYKCPKSADGQRLGPLVGYAGRDENGRQKVGDVYLNAAVLEHSPYLLQSCAEKLLYVVSNFVSITHGLVYCGAPMGGITLAALMAREMQEHFIYPEKEILKPASEHSREFSRLVFKRHEVRKDDKVVIVEDVCNNFSTTGELVELIASHGGKVVAIACLVNRSPDVRTSYYHKLGVTSGQLIPVLALLNKPFPQYLQDDPAVAEDIAKGNVVWKPKDNWTRLMQAMILHQSGA